MTLLTEEIRENNKSHAYFANYNPKHSTPTQGKPKNKNIQPQSQINLTTKNHQKKN